MKRSILLLLPFILLLGGCWKKESDPLQVTLARVNDEVVTLGALLALLPDKDYPDAESEKTSSSETDALKKELLDQLIERKMLLQEANRLNVFLDAIEIKNQINLLRDGMDEKTFFEGLRAQNIPINDWEKSTRDNLLIEKLLNQLAREDDEDALSVSEETVHRYYENNREQWKVGEQLKLRQIIVDTEAKAQALYLSLLEGEGFSETARLHSRFPTMEEGGDLGYVSRSGVPIEFDPLFQAEVGSISTVIKTPFGYHLVLLEDKKPERILPFDEVKEKVYQRLLDQKREQVFSKWIAKLRQRTEVRINEALLKAIN